MKKILFSLIVLASLSIVYKIFSNKNLKGGPAEKISGAYEALSFFGEARTYPGTALPENAYFAAWQEKSRMAEASLTDRDVDPWETMGPHNRGGRTLGLTFNPQNENTLYAGSASGGLWRSYTAGVGIDAWERVDIGLPVLGVSCIEFMPGDSTDMFIGTGEVYNYFAAGTGAADRATRGSYGIGILRSMDGGETWAPSLDFSYDQNKGIWDIEISPSDPSIIYAATTDGVYKSTDGGGNWALIHDVVMANDLVIHPDDPNLVVCGHGNLGSAGKGIYRSTDGGATWTQITENLPSNFQGKIQLDYAPSQPNTVYASIGNGFSSATGASWLCRSDDFGENWVEKNTTDYSIWQGWFAHDVAVSPADPDEITVIGIEVWKSFDGGDNLIKVSDDNNGGGIGALDPPIEGPDGPPNFVHSDAHAVIYHPSNPDIFYVANDGGIHRSVNGNFASCNGRYQTAQFYNGFANSYQDPNFCQGGLQDNGSIQWNGEGEDGGVTWSRVFGGDGSWAAVDPDNDNINYVSWQRLNIQKTTNGSFAYSSIAPPYNQNVSFIAPFLVAPTNGDVIYAGADVIAKSTNGGNSWQLSGVFDGGNPALSMSMSYQNTDVVYVGTAPLTGNPGGIFVTTDGGQDWNDVTTSTLPDRFPMDIQVDPTGDSTAYIAYSGYGTGHVFRTTDFGQTWQDISDGLPNVPANAVEVDPLFPNNIYVGTDIGVFVSVDWGETWETFGDGLPTATMAFDLKISPANRKLRVATHGLGVYQRDLLEAPFVSSVHSPSANELLKLSVSPNPAKSFANMNYELTENIMVDIKILDGAGRTVNTVFSGKQMSGKQQFSLPVNELSSGIYFVRIIAGDMVGVERLIVK